VLLPRLGGKPWGDTVWRFSNLVQAGKTLAIGKVGADPHAFAQAKVGSRAHVHDAYVCPVLFLDLVASSKKSIGEQTLAKRRLNAAILTAMSDIAPNERLILDVGDGVAIASFATPGARLGWD